MMTALLTGIRRLNPLGRLTVTCHYPKEETLVFRQRLRKGFTLDNHPGQVFDLMSLQVKPDLPGLERFVSDGAIAGAGAAAALGWDTMEGAIMGDWWEKRRAEHREVHDLELVLAPRDGQPPLVFGFSLSPDDCKTLYRYFIGV